MKDETLNLYVDGRLPPDEALRVEQALLRDAALRERLDALVMARQAVHEAFSAADDLPDFDEVWGGVEARLDAEPARSPTLLLRLFPGLSEGLAWWRQPAFAYAAGAAALVLLLGGLWLVSGVRHEGSPTAPEQPQVASTAPEAAPVVPGVRRELPEPGNRRGMVSEEPAKRSLAIIESYDVERGVVVVARPTGSARQPLVIWHLVPGEELDDEEVMP